ncbi:MAG: Tricarboxylate transport protein TctC, partial [uncultured Nocardioides sp.]
APVRVRGDPRCRLPRPADDHPQQPRRRLRPDGPRRGGRDGGQRGHGRLLHRRQRHRRGRGSGDDRADRRRRRRADGDDRRPRRGGLDVLLRQLLQPPGRDPAGPADERARGDPGAGRLAVPDGGGLRGGVDGRSRLAGDRRRLLAGRARPPLPDAARGRGRDRPPRRQLRLLRRRRPADQRAAGREDRRRLLRAGGVPGQHRGRRAADAGGVGGGAVPAGGLRRGADAHRVGHRPGLPQLAGPARPSRHLRGAPRRADRLPGDDARDRGVAGGADGQRLDRRLHHRRRVRRLPAGAGPARRRHPRGAGSDL